MQTDQSIRHGNEVKWEINGKKHGRQSIRPLTFARSFEVLLLSFCPFAHIIPEIEFWYIWGYLVPKTQNPFFDTGAGNAILGPGAKQRKW